MARSKVEDKDVKVMPVSLLAPQDNVIVLDEAGYLLNPVLRMSLRLTLFFSPNLENVKMWRGKMYVLDIFDRFYFRVILLLLLLQFFEDNSDVCW